jgi:acetyltransferase-like isoleucine patch superfamily enzyme
VYLAAAGHDTSSGSMAYQNRPIRIGRSAWVATRALIGPGVTVGEGAVIGAGAVVLKDVPPNSVMVGNPAVAVGVRRITRP